MLIKSADEKSSDLKLLEALETQNLNRQQQEWLQEKLWALRTGIQGEKDAAYYINAEYGDSKNYAVLHDLRIELDGETAQIDHVLLGHHFAFLLETKNFNGNISINEYGEFTVEYPRSKPRGIPSPLEQSHRHERIFSKLLDHLNIRNTATDEKIKVYHVVLFSPKSIIKRPDNQKFDTSNIIKADALRLWRDNFKSDEILRAKTLLPFIAKAILKPKNWISEPGPEIIEEYAQKLAAHHVPAPALTLPDFMCIETTEKTAPEQTAQMLCDTCKQPISKAEARFCSIHKTRFNGKHYCREHQQAFPNKTAEQNDTKEPAAQAVYCDESGCAKKLTAAVIDFCAKNTKRFNGKHYCMTHQKRKPTDAV